MSQWQLRCANELRELRELADAAVIITGEGPADGLGMSLYNSMQEGLDRLFSEALPESGPSQPKQRY
eukprot:jgi/Chrzof1/93/Cz01g03080.t1